MQGNRVHEQTFYIHVYVNVRIKIYCKWRNLQQRTLLKLGITDISEKFDFFGYSTNTTFPNAMYVMHYGVAVFSGMKFSDITPIIFFYLK